MVDFSNYSPKSKYYDDSNKVVVRKMYDETGDVAIKKFVGLKPNMYSCLVDYSLEHKKAKGASINVVETISHSEYKDALLNHKSLRHSINRIQSKDHEIRTYEITKIYLPFFDSKIHILNTGYDGLFQLIMRKQVIF